MTELKDRVKIVCSDRFSALGDLASNEVANLKRDQFNFSTWAYAVESEMQSPIEALFYLAFYTINEISPFCSHNGEPSPFIGEKDFLIAFPQHHIGKYRADFGCFYGLIKADLKHGYSYDGKWVAVELDGHEFHDRSEKQRRYEKLRDRFFQKHGYQVFRFTGAEIHANPFNSAVEVIAELKGLDEKELWESLPDSFYGEKL